MTASTQTLAEHPERGWLVDPKTGHVFGVAGHWKGKRIGILGDHGYWKTARNGRTYLLHRVVWEACVGPIPPKMVINHKNGIKTDNRLCNLEVVTSGENNVHARRTGLHRQVNPCGPANWNYRITPEIHADVLARLGRGETGASIARLYGVSQTTIRRIKQGVRCPS